MTFLHLLFTMIAINIFKEELKGMCELILIFAHRLKSKPVLNNRKTNSIIAGLYTCYEFHCKVKQRKHSHLDSCLTDETVMLHKMTCVNPGRRNSVNTFPNNTISRGAAVVWPTKFSPMTPESAKSGPPANRKNMSSHHRRSCILFLVTNIIKST